MRYECVVMGASAGGLLALKRLFSSLPETFPLPIIVVQHLSKEELEPTHLSMLQSTCNIPIQEVQEKEEISAGTIYFAPSGYHCLVEIDRSLSLSLELPNCFSIPGIDPLFETAAEAYQDSLIAVLLTGASSDGSIGLKQIQKLGGITIVQSPEDAESSLMPKSALQIMEPNAVMPLESIANELVRLAGSGY